MAEIPDAARLIIDQFLSLESAESFCWLLCGG
jgi:hypothetical protein